MIEVRRGDLADVLTGAVLRPISSEGDPVTPMGRRLEVAAGSDLGSRLDWIGELPVGGAVITPGGNLSAAFVIHVVVQSAVESVSAVGVERALVNGVRRAAEWGVDEVALPPVGLGPGNLDPEEAARIAVKVIRDHLATGEPPSTFTIVVENDFEEQLYFRQVTATSGLNGGV